MPGCVDLKLDQMIDEGRIKNQYVEKGLSHGRGIGISERKVYGGVDMRENLREFQFNRRSLKSAGLALLPLLACSVVWADNYTLESVDFVSNGEKTNIVFHTGSIVPVQRVLVSNNKLILDIDQINADETVKTNFDKARNISHIIMQPLGEHKMRMIIRGENLGTPAIAFFNPTANAVSATNPDYSKPEDPATTLQAIQEQGTQPAALNPDAEQGMEQPAIDVQPLPSAQADVIPADTIPMDPLQPAPTSKTPMEALTAPLTLPADNAATQTENRLPFFDYKLPRLPHSWETYIPYGLLGLFLLGIFGFVGYRVFKLKQAGPTLEDWMTDETAEMPKRSSFQKMAAAYRNKREQQKTPTKKHSDEPIGLRHLKQMEIIDEPPVVKAPEAPKAARPAHAAPQQAEPNPTRALENLLSALQANQLHKVPPAAPKVAAPKQAVNQYLKAQPQAKSKATKPAASIPARDREYQETMQRELKRAQEIQSQVKKQIQSGQPLQQRKPNPALKQAPLNRAPAARKTAPVSRPNATASNQGPLPGNPEVLNFLRNVADLMEKDGKTDIAKSIHKNLSTQNLSRL
jgi:hypothetical protein